jgi:hypothetical protein
MFVYIYFMTVARKSKESGVKRGMEEDNKTGKKDAMLSRRITLEDGRYMIFYTFPNMPGNGLSAPSETESDAPSETAKEKNV